MKKEDVVSTITEFIKKTTNSQSDILVEVQKSKDGTESIYFGVNVNEPHFYLHNNGEALQALNHIAKRILEKDSTPIPTNTKNNLNILIDINNFQKKKIESIHALAHMMAERARYFKSNIDTDPMSAFERRIIHEFLSDATDIKTESEGFGRERRVVIKYIGGV